MKRWNAWGLTTTEVSVPRPFADLLLREVGPASPGPEVSFEQSLQQVPASRLTDEAGLDTSPQVRLRNAVGQSFPDWVRIRRGCVPRFVDAVATPSSEDEVEAILRRAQALGARVLVRGGGTSVAGHFELSGAEVPVILMCTDRLNRLLSLDRESGLAELEGGATGPEVEAALGEHGFMLGHHPQSFELSTLGGWVATRSAGHFSQRYGRIEDLFVGGRVITPRGSIETQRAPASAAGPSVQQLILGSEGRLGLISRCVVKVRRQPETQVFHGAYLPDAVTATLALREIAQAELGLTMSRLSLPHETQTSFAMSDGMGAKALSKVVDLIQGDQACLLLFGAAGAPKRVHAQLAEVRRIVKKHHGIVIGSAIGKHWYQTRFLQPYMRESLWKAGYGADTAETAVPWSQVEATVADIRRRLKTALSDEGEAVHVFTHLSHVYPHGASIYTTYMFRLASNPEADLARWAKLKAAISGAIVAHGGTISHQHGVGHDHKPYLKGEKGELALDALRAALHAVDPEHLFDTGNLV